MLNDKLESQLISYEDYFSKISALSKKDSDDKKKKTDLENFWSDSAVKSQLDDGTALLSALGNNSKTAHKLKQGLAAGNTIMTTAENINEQFPNPAGMASAALVGATQLATIISSTADGGGTITTPSVSTETTTESYNEQSATVTDISGDSISTQRLVIEFSDEAVDAVGRHVKKAESDGRI